MRWAGSAGEVFHEVMIWYSAAPSTLNVVYSSSSLATSD